MSCDKTNERSLITMSPVASPCVNICALDSNDICIGCYRNVREISEWYLLSDAEKHQVLIRTAHRAKAQNRFLGDESGSES